MHINNWDNCSIEDVVITINVPNLILFLIIVVTFVCVCVCVYIYIYIYIYIYKNPTDQM